MLLGQMVEPPESEIPVPLGQAISNLQSGDYSRAFGGSDMGSLLLGRGEGSSAAGGSADQGLSALQRPGFAPGSFLPGPNQQGAQTREDLGMTPRKDYMGPFVPSTEDIQRLGLPAVRSDVKGLNQLRNRIGRLEERKAVRESVGKTLKPGAERRLTKLKARADVRAKTGMPY